MDSEIDTAAKRHGLSPAAADTLYQALVAGGGHQAQFNHPELGGMGQWSGGMTQIGAMFDDALKAKVGGFCQEVAAVARRAAKGGAPAEVRSDPARAGGASPGGWWPDGLGSPSSSGAQNGVRYACFPERRRLVIERDGRVTLYDTGDHRLTGFSQQQGTISALLFSGPDGPVSLDRLPVVSS